MGIEDKSFYSYIKRFDDRIQYTASKRYKGYISEFIYYKKDKQLIITPNKNINSCQILYFDVEFENIRSEIDSAIKIILVLLNNPS